MKPDKRKPVANLTLPFRDMGGEKLLQFIWQFGYFNKTDLTTVEGEKVSVILPGTINKNGGPDFTAAKIRIGDTTFFGNVELHLRTSDWEKHHHETDKQYGTVVLHVVFQHDKELNHTIPVLELEPRISSLLLERYNALMNGDNFVPCAASVSGIKELVWASWKERLLVERLTRKAGLILQLLKESNNHWEEVCWWLVARAFGMKVNGEAFEAIAKTVPLTVLAKHRSSIHQIEALLFGQAGLLNEEFEEDYPKMLKQEYSYLQKKLSLNTAFVQLQFMRMRPVNFPTIRLAQLSAFIHQSSHLFSRMLDAKDVDEIKLLFQLNANDYWHYHYTFRQPSSFKKKTLGSDAIDNIIINTVVPVLFAYGLHHKEERHKEKSLHWLEKSNAEQNIITKGFSGLGLKNKNAFDSQALIELKNEYCSHKRCLQCSVGNNILKADNLQTLKSNPTAP